METFIKNIDIIQALKFTPEMIIAMLLVGGLLVFIASNTGNKFLKGVCFTLLLYTPIVALTIDILITKSVTPIVLWQAIFDAYSLPSWLLLLPCLGFTFALWARDND